MYRLSSKRNRKTQQNLFVRFCMAYPVYDRETKRIRKPAQEPTSFDSSHRLGRMMRRRSA